MLAVALQPAPGPGVPLCWVVYGLACCRWPAILTLDLQTQSLEPVRIWVLPFTARERRLISSWPVRHTILPPHCLRVFQCSPQLGLLVATAEVHGPDSPQHARMVCFMEQLLVFTDRVCLLAPRSYLEAMWVPRN